MSGRLVLFSLTCLPFLLTLGAWGKLCWARCGPWPRTLALVALGIVTANAALAAGTFVYYAFRPVADNVPPWDDPQILQLGLEFLLAPTGMIVGLVAAARGAPKWLVAIVEVASVPLLLIGILATCAV